MKRMFITILAAAIATVLVAASTVEASTRFERRAARQRARIADGVHQHRLGPGETARLRAGQLRVRELRRMAMADGVVTLRERRLIARAQNRQSRLIHRMKHNVRGGQRIL